VFFIFPLLYMYDLCLFDLDLNNKPKCPLGLLIRLNNLVYRDLKT